MDKRLNSLGKTLYDTEENSKLDAAVKRLLSQKPILAFIMKYTVKEFSSLEANEIIPLIDAVSVSSIPVEPGSTNDMITGVPQESRITGEGYVTYDIRFFASAPGDENTAEYNLIINVEAQGRPKKSYWLESRGIFYCGRMLSEQLGRNVKNSHYEKLQKVYSIWICMNCSREDANTISEYGITQRSCVGDYTGDPRIDLLSVVMIRLPKDDEWEKAKNPSTKLTKMLATVLSDHIAPSDKIASLENEYGIEATEEIQEEVNDMCNYSSVLAEKVADENTKKVELDKIFSLVKNLNLSPDKAMDALDIDPDKREEYAKELEQRVKS